MLKFFIVLYCTLLTMAQTIKERKDLETKMKVDPELAEILHQLSEEDQKDLVQVSFFCILLT